jgi:hypothetical protein
MRSSPDELTGSLSCRCGAGHARLRLDTRVRQAQAIALHERLGFRTVPAYYPIPEGIEDWLLFFERPL